MKLLEYKQYNDDTGGKQLNKKKVGIASVCGGIILIFLIALILYISSANVRNFMDKYLLMKNVFENNLPSISVDADEDLCVFAYSDYIATLENNKLALYNTSAKEVENMKINISNPVYSVKRNYLIIGEKNNNKVYLIKDKKILWEKEVEGKISRVNVNNNGYTSVIVSGTSYKSVIYTYSEDGTELFKTFLSNTVVTDVEISNDNKNLSYCEMDLSGALISNRVKTISIENARKNPEYSIIHVYDIPINSLVVNLEYHEKNNLLCMCDNVIYNLKDGELIKLEDINNKITFAGVKFANCYFKIVEDMYGINHQNCNLEIYNTNNQNKNMYSINGVPKSVTSCEKVIAVNVGTDVYFVNDKGWLIKKYKSNREVKDVIVANNIAGIIYRNKIEIVNL